MFQIGIDQIQNIAQIENHPFKESLVKELSGLIKVSEFNEGNDASRLYSIYSTRFRINQSVTKYNAIEGWLPLIPNLEKVAKIKNIKVVVFPITTESAEYLHFLSDDLAELYGVLKFTERKISRDQELDEIGNLKGTWTDQFFFDNGLLVKNGA